MIVVSILIIGVGNDCRGDDGAGLAVVRAVEARKVAWTRCLESDGDCVTLLEAWQTAEYVILIDAVVSGARPGTVYRLDARVQPVPAAWTLCSTHAFGITETLALARVLGAFPASLRIYGIEGEQFAIGEALSPPVKRAVEKVTTQILREIEDKQKVSSSLCPPKART